MNNVNNKTLIIGAGIAGLLAAQRLLEKNHVVTLMDQHGVNFTRGNRLRQSKSFLQFLFTHVLPDGSFRVQSTGLSNFVEVHEVGQDDLDCIEYGNRNSWVVSIASIQAYIYGKISDRVNVVQHRFVDIRDSEVQGFDNIVIATGKIPITAHLLRFALCGTQELSAPLDSTYTRHVGVRVNVSDLNSKLMQGRFTVPFRYRTAVEKRHMLSIVSRMGWRRNRLPIAFTHVSENDIYFVGEIPDDLTDDKLHEWVQARIELEHPQLDEAEFNIIDHNHNSFDLKPKFAKRAYHDFFGSNIFVIGDALVKSYYPFGNGCDFASRAVNSLALCFSDKGTFQSHQPLENTKEQLVKLHHYMSLKYKLLLYMQRNSRQGKLFFAALAAKRSIDATSQSYCKLIS